MKTTKKLKVYYSKTEMNKGFVAITLTGLLSMPRFLAFFPSQNTIGKHLPKFMQNFIFFALPLIPALLGVGIMYAMFFFNLEAPALVLSEDGMWVKEIGFIDWDNIETIGTYTNRSPKMLSVWIKDTKKVFQQASIQGKFSILYSKIFHQRPHPITFANLNMKHEEIIAFAKQYIE